MEMWYDYGYVDISSDGGDSWATIATFNNKGFLHPGTGADWDSPTFGHPQEDVSSYAGTDIRLRFRFESDCFYSSEDQEDNPHHSVKDGAWQLDNIEVKVGGTTAWLDGCETGENGWEHTDVPASAQVGLAFWRGQFGVDFVTGRPVLPHEPPAGTWMQAAVGPDLSSLVDDQVSWLYSPPVDIDGAPGLVCEWTGWLDLPRESNDYGGQFVGSGDVFECITFGDLEPDLLDIGPGWTTEHLNWSPYVGNKWLKAAWAVWGGIPDPGRDHLAGLFLNRVRVGVPLETGAPSASSSRGLALGHPL